MTDAGQDEFRTGRKQDWTDAGHDACREGRMQDRMEAGQDMRQERTNAGHDRFFLLMGPQYRVHTCLLVCDR